MKSGDTENLENITPFDFHNSIRITLNESRGQDWSASFELNARQCVINTRLTHVFRRDRGIVGDAQYTLIYRMRRLPVR